MLRVSNVTRAGSGRGAADMAAVLRTGKAWRPAMPARMQGAWRYALGVLGAGCGAQLCALDLFGASSC
jgi:hypothetical protein